jgi:hypothetical protein
MNPIVLHEYSPNYVLSKYTVNRAMPLDTIFIPGRIFLRDDTISTCMNPTLVSAQEIVPQYLHSFSDMRPREIGFRQWEISINR